MTTDRKYIYFVGARFRVRIRNFGSVGSFGSMAEAVAARDAFVEKNKDRLPRVRTNAKPPMRRAVVVERQSRIGSLWCEEWRDRLMREKYSACESTTALAAELGVTVQQLYARARTVGINREATIIQREAEKAALKGSQRSAELRAQSDCWTPADTSRIVQQALANMPPLQAAIAQGWRAYE